MAHLLTRSRTGPGAATAPVLAWALAALLPLCGLAWLALLHSPARDAVSAAWGSGIVLMAALSMAWVAKAGQAGGLALMGLAAATVALSDATLPGTRAGALDAQSAAKFALWTTGLLLLVWRWREARAALRHAPSGWMAGLGLWCVVSSLWSATPVYTAGAALALLGLWALGGICAQSLSLRQGLLALVAGLLLPLMLSLALWRMAPSLALNPMDGGWLLRLGGVFGSPNGLGRAAALCVLLSILAWPMRRQPADTVLLLAGVGIGAGALSLSDSRGAHAALAAGLAALLLLRRPGVALLLLPLATAGLLLLLGVPGLLDTVLDRISRTGRMSELSSLTGRTAIWSASLDLIAQSPWVGHGFGSTRDVLPAAYQGAHGWTTTSAHNLWLQVAVTTGGVGLTLLLAQQTAWLRAAWRQTVPAREAVLVFVTAVGILEASALGPSVNLLSFVTAWALALGLRGRDD